MKNRFLSLVVLIALSGYVNTQPVYAQSKDSAEQRRAEQVRKLQEQNQQLRTEKTNAEAARAKAEAEFNEKLNQTKAQVGQQSSRLNKDLAGARSRLSELQRAKEAEAAAAAATLEQVKGQLASAIALAEQRQREVEAGTKQLAKLQTDLNLSKQQTEAQTTKTGFLDKQLAACAANNRTLVSLVDDVSEAYRTKPAADSRSVLEPLLGLRRAEFDRLAEEYRSKAGNERFYPEAAKSNP
jgi:chromosome segregation ATPase